MTIYLPPGLPIARNLRLEGHDVGWLTEEGARGALRVALVNLMPDKEATELAFSRLLAQSGRPVALSLVVPEGYEPRHASPAHLAAHYTRWPAVRLNDVDALIVTGAPVETLPFEAVSYWAELREMVEGARVRSIHSLFVCWAALAALRILHGVPKRQLPAKAFGVFDQEVPAASGLTRGMGPRFPVPVSRHAEADRECLARAGLAVLAGSERTGSSIVEDRKGRAVFVFDHLEYEGDTLEREYERDLREGRPVPPPETAASGQSWHAVAALFFRNWLDAVTDARGRPEGDAPLAWLFEERRSAARGETEIFLQAAPRPHLLSEVLTQLATVGADPSFVRVMPGQGDRCEVGIRITASPRASMDGVADALLAIDGARQALIRMWDGSGGVYQPRRRFDHASAA